MRGMPCVGRAMADYCVLCWFLLKLHFAVEALRNVIVRVSLLSEVDVRLPAVQLIAMQIADRLLKALWLFVHCEGVLPQGVLDSS